jgi:hypothetical protein
MEQEKSMTQQESMQLIGEMISKAKKSYVTKGLASIAWGVIIVVCSLVSWSQAYFKYDLNFDIWLLALLALIPQLYFSIKERKSKKFTAHDEVTAGYIWMAFGISIFILSLYFSHQPQGGQSSTLVMMLYAMPTFITGGLCKFKPMIIGGIICWAASIISIFTSTAVDLLLMAACGFFAWLIPGLILWHRYKKQQAADV